MTTCTGCIDYHTCKIRVPFMPGCLQYDYYGGEYEDPIDITTFDYVDGLPAVEPVPSDTGRPAGDGVIIPFPVHPE